MQPKLLYNARYRMRLAISRNPAIYFSLLDLLNSPRRHLKVTKSTDIVIEGYPRSANTFAVAAFLFAQGKDISIARHLHAPAQIIAAADLGIPAMVLIRNPKDAILSLLVRDPSLSAKNAILHYIHFYESIYAYQKNFLLVNFQDVIRDYGSCIELLNKKFNTNFLTFKNTKENIEAVYRLIEKMDMDDRRQGAVSELTVARPSEFREKIKQLRQNELYTNTNAKLLRTATSIYNEMSGG